MPVISANVSPMHEGNLAAVRPGRIDCIYNRTRGRNIKDFSRKVVPIKLRTEADRNKISGPRKAVSVNTPVHRTATPTRVATSTPLIDSKKANFEAYLRNRTSRRAPPSISVTQPVHSVRPHLKHQLTDPGSVPANSRLVTQGSLSNTGPPTKVLHQYQRSGSVPTTTTLHNLLAPPDPHKHLREALSHQPNKGPKVSVLLANPSTKSPGIRLTTASPPPARHQASTADSPTKQGGVSIADSTTKQGGVSRMDSHDSGYGNSPGKSIDKSDSVDISEIEAEYYKTIPPNRQMSAANVPLYVNKLSELFTTKRNFEAFLKSEFKYVAVASVIEAARGFVITASKEDVQFLKVKLPMVIPGGCSVHEMSSDEEINTFYLILKPIPEDITISTVMRCLIEKRFPVKKIKRISNKVTREKTKVVVVTLESTHKKLMSILETGTILIGAHTVRAFLLYPNTATSRAAHLMTSTETSADNSPMASEDYTLGTLSPLGGSQWSSGAFDSVESGSRPASGSGPGPGRGEPGSRPASRCGRGPGTNQNKNSDSESPTGPALETTRNGQNAIRQPEQKALKHDGETRSLPSTGSNRKPNPNRNQTDQISQSQGGIVLAPPHESSVYSAIERMLISCKTGIHPVLQNQGVKRPHEQTVAPGPTSSQSTPSNYQQYSSPQRVMGPDPERCKSPSLQVPARTNTVSANGSEPSDGTVIQPGQQVTSSPNNVISSRDRSSSAAQSNMAHSSQPREEPMQNQTVSGRLPSNKVYKSKLRPQRSRKRTTSNERELKPSSVSSLSTLPEDGSNQNGDQSQTQSGQVPPPKPKRTLRPGQCKEVNGETKGSALAEAMVRGIKQTCDLNQKVSFKVKEKVKPPAISVPKNSVPKSKTNNKVVRNVSVQYEEMSPDFSEFMLDQEDSYFCKLDGLVKLMKERPTSQETEDLLMKVREANLARSRYGVTHVEPGRNEQEEKATEDLIGEMLKGAAEAKQRMVSGEVSPPDTFCFKDIVKSPPDPIKKAAADTMMKTALERMIKKQSITTPPTVNPPVSVPTPTSTSSPSSSNCVFVSDNHKKTRRKTASENFAVANSHSRNDLDGALISRIVKNDIVKSDDVSRDSYSVQKNEEGRSRRKSCSQIIVTSSRKPHRPSVLQCSGSGSQCSTSSEQSLMADLSKTVAVSNERVSGRTRRNGRAEPGHVNDILSSMFVNKARVTSDDSSGGGRSARDKFMSSSSPSFNHDQSIDEDMDTDMEIFVNKARETDRKNHPEKSSAVLKSQGGTKNSYGNSNNSTIHSVMNSFLEEAMLKKMGSTLGDINESNFY